MNRIRGINGVNVAKLVTGNGLIGPTVTTSQIDGWRRIMLNPFLIIKWIAMVQRTWRGMGFIPTWTSFWASEHGRSISLALDSGQVAKLRAWWDVMVECGDCDFPDGQRALAYALTVYKFESIRRENGRIGITEIDKFGLGSDRAGQIQEKVLGTFDALSKK